MNELLPENAVVMHDGSAVTTSLMVAEVFGKKHKHVLDSVRKIDVPEEFGRPNFRPSSYQNEQQKEQPMYEITKDGFAFLVMGFTGAKAMKFKIAYINRFNEMETVLKQEYLQPIAQVENYWFSRRPLWPSIRVRVLAGETYRAIADAIQISRGRVARAVKRMIAVGILDPRKVANVQIGPAKKAAQRYGEGWGQSQQLSLFA